MPLRNFIDPTNGARVPLEAAARYFEDEGLMPYEVISSIVKEETEQARDPRHVSPSIADPETTCRRQVLIQRFLDYDLDPYRLWDRWEGKAWHEAQEKKIQEHLGRPVTILKDRRGGNTRGVPMSMRQLRARIEAGETVSRFEWGGCGCFGD